MREITTHSADIANEPLKLFADDERGPGGANHSYEIRWVDKFGGRVWSYIKLQNGPIGEAGVNGVTNEVLLAIVADRLKAFQEGAYACPENATALAGVNLVLDTLHSRTRDRRKRGVEGTSKR